MSAQAVRRLILNADDYAMDAAVDEAVLILASRGIVKAVSAMVLSPVWRAAAAGLRSADVDCGLHFDLTSPFAAAIFPRSNPTRLIADAYGRRIAKPKLRSAIERQLDLFEDAMGRAPDFVDGHQHVHQLPDIRTEILSALERRYGRGAAGIAIRICRPRRWRGVKAAVIGLLGARRLAALAASCGHSINSDFVGVYDFSPQADLSACWGQWLASLQGETPLAMCHIAVSGAPADDPIRQARLREFTWLASEEFRDLCGEFFVTPGRWPRKAHQAL